MADLLVRRERHGTATVLVRRERRGVATVLVGREKRATDLLVRARCKRNPAGLDEISRKIEQYTHICFVKY